MHSACFFYKRGLYAEKYEKVLADFYHTGHGCFCDWICNPVHSRHLSVVYKIYNRQGCAFCGTCKLQKTVCRCNISAFLLPYTGFRYCNYHYH